MATMTHISDEVLDKMQTQMNVKALLRRFQESAPVDVKGIAEHFGIRVWELHDLAPNSGTIFVDPKHGGQSGYSIGVNASEGFRRKRFTIAHELGHFVLHRNDIGDGITDDALYRSGLSSAKEREANRFAADLLMPQHLIMRVLHQGNHDVASLANLFAVSEAAMRIRLGIPVT